MNLQMILIYIFCIIGIFIIGKVFIIPIKWIIKLIFNSILGGILIYIFNIIMGIWEIHIGINLLTVIIVGILGIPGAILLFILTLII